MWSPTLFITAHREQSDGMYRPGVYLLWRMADELIVQLTVLWGVVSGRAQLQAH